ncbi:MAG: hypothetical protein ACI8WB_000181 [Phenylobacterium sp.]|jgi:hypothetical protein
MYKIRNIFTYSFLCLLMLTFAGPSHAAADDAKMKGIIGDISKMYLASMVYIFKNQKLINQEGGDKKDLFGQNFINNIKTTYKGRYKADFPAEDHNAKKMLVQAMIEVMEDNRALLSDTEIGFKGFIPAIYAFQLAEKLSVKGVGLKIKFTRTKEGLRNRLNSPDEWEMATMEKVKKEPKPYYDSNAVLNGKPAYRQFTPLPMKPFCLNCHGIPEQNPLNKGKDKSAWTSTDVTGFTMENWKITDFGGGVSISIEKSSL